MTAVGGTLRRQLFNAYYIRCLRAVLIWQNKGLLCCDNPDSLAPRESIFAHAVATGYGRPGFWSGRSPDAAQSRPFG